MNDSDLDKLLRSAGNEIPLPPSFKRTVWQRIESSSADCPGFKVWLEMFLYPLTRPIIATTAILGMIALGLGLGAVGSSDSENLKAAYVQSVSPFLGGHE